METITNDVFSRWREEGSQRIKENFDIFRKLVLQAKNFTQSRKYDAAAVYVEMAASYACLQHCGLFISPELEEILLTIGKERITKTFDYSDKKSLLETPQKILHVVTSVYSIGGHSKIVWRWIQQDSQRSHSLVVTRQSRKQIPNIISDTITNSGGKIYALNENIGSLISWAEQLRKIAATADLVVLHTLNHDVIPMIAFANKEQCPPVIFLDHADHMFWLGSNICDVVVNLRESGMRISQQRKAIEAKRNILLPIILRPIERVLSRTQAKQQLKLPEDCIVLLCVARSPKYTTINGFTYADAHVSLLQQHKNAVLVVVGAGERKDWLTAIQKVEGRIVVHPEREDTAVFYQAADIYVDSFPFVSTTSLLEAGSYGVPLVTRYPYSDASGILGVDMPGLTGNLICVRHLDEYTTVLSHLIEDREFRVKLGEATKQKIAEIHTGENWQCYLNDVYRLALSLPKITSSSTLMDQMFLGEPDVYMPRIHGLDVDVDKITKRNLTLMPVNQRLIHWFKLLNTPEFYQKGERFSPFKYLLPEWLMCRLRDKLKHT